jgi:hypothetical protein
VDSSGGHAWSRFVAGWEWGTFSLLLSLLVFPGIPYLPRN